MTYFADGDVRPYLIRDIPDDWKMPKAAAKGQVTCLFMPRWASRITLECEESARVENLQNITHDEAIWEGVEKHESCPEIWRDYTGDRHHGCISPVHSFQSLWSTLHAKPGEVWADNPEVVRVGRFRIVDGHAAHDEARRAKRKGEVKA